MNNILEYKTNYINPYVIVAAGLLKGVEYSTTKAVHSVELITYIFEQRKSSKTQEFRITPFFNTDEVNGIYLGTVRRRNDQLVHFYYEKRDIKDSE